MPGIWIEIGGKRHRVVLGEDVPTQVDDEAYSVQVHDLGQGVLSLLWTGPDGRTHSFRFIAGEDADGVFVTVAGERFDYAVFDPRSVRSVTAAATASGPKALKAPMPGRVVRVLVAMGETVTAGQGCLVIEAMKMQNELKAPKAGVVRKLMTAVEDTVATGAILLVID